MDVSRIEDVAVACSLAGARYGDRRTQWHEVLGTVSREQTAAGVTVVRLPAGRAAVLAELVVAEQECCPFLAFRLVFEGATVELTVDAPAHARPLVADLLGAPAEGAPAGEARNQC